MSAALASIFTLITAGAIARRWPRLAPRFWLRLERLVYFVLFPALLVRATATADLTGAPILPLAATLVLATALTLAGAFLCRGLAPGGAAFSSLFQGAIRFNTYIGFSVVLATLGEAGLTTATWVIAILIPMANILSVLVLTLGREPTKPSPAAGLLVTTLTTPPLAACLAGLTLNLLGFHLPALLDQVLAIAGRGSLPLGLLAVGASLDCTTLRRRLAPISAATALKLLFYPAATWAIGRSLGLAAPELGVAVLFTGLPGSASSYILARQLGGDSPLMAAIVTVQVAASALCLPLLLTVLELG